jgi:sugar phosphate isomerase/epimerase
MPLYLCDNGHLEQIAPLCQRHKCGIEVQAFYDPSLLLERPEAVEEHQALLVAIPQRALHGPFGDLCPGSFDPLVRELARHRFDGAVAVMRALHAGDLVLHHGYVPGTSHPSNWVRRSTAFWSAFLQAHQGRLRVHLENLLERDPAMLIDLVDAVGDPRLDVCLDVGHVHCHSPLPLPDWIRRLGPRIGYVHLHSNHGEADQHLALGQGTLNMEKALGALLEHAPQAAWAIEASPVQAVVASLEWLDSRGLRPSD